MTQYEGFTSVANSASNISDNLQITNSRSNTDEKKLKFEEVSKTSDTSTDVSGCGGIPLFDFNTDLVLSYISPDIAYAIMSYSTGGYNYLPTLQASFKDADATTQMAMSALLGRYLAFNGGSAAIPGPGYTNTSPGNYVAQLKGARDLLIPTKIDPASPVYKSFQAATTVAMCPSLNKRWVSTADF